MFRPLDNSLESVKMKLELLRMGSVEDIGRLTGEVVDKAREEKNKEERESKQSQMSLSLKVNFLNGFRFYLVFSGQVFEVFKNGYKNFKF